MMADSKGTDLKKGIALALLAALLWSGNYIIARGLYREIAPVSLAFFRWLTATVVLTPIAYNSVRKEVHLIREHWILLSVTALLGVTLFNTFIYVAGSYSSAINLAIIGTTAAPILVLALAAIFLKEKVTGLQVAGMMICILGILVLVTKGHLQNLGSFQASRGDVWILAAALSFALYTLLVRRKPKTLSSLTYLFMLFLLGTIFLLPAYAIDLSRGHSFLVTPNLIAVFLYLGAGASVGAFLSWNVAIQKMGAARTALFATGIPIFSSIEAVIILGEEASWVLVVSLLLIVCGLVVANLKNMRPSTTE
jgi:drug/metabolite transporter (DMT)-like permease